MKIGQLLNFSKEKGIEKEEIHETGNIEIFRQKEIPKKDIPNAKKDIPIAKKDIPIAKKKVFEKSGGGGKTSNQKKQRNLEAYIAKQALSKNKKESKKENKKESKKNQRKIYFQKDDINRITKRSKISIFDFLHNYAHNQKDISDFLFCIRKKLVLLLFYLYNMKRNVYKEYNKIVFTIFQISDKNTNLKKKNNKKESKKENKKENKEYIQSNQSINKKSINTSNLNEINIKIKKLKKKINDSELNADSLIHDKLLKELLIQKYKMNQKK
jgi:hypothetical protein